MEVKLGSATFNVSFGDNYDEDPFGDGTPGFGGFFEVNRKQFAELREACPFEAYSLNEEDATFNPEEDDEDEEISVPNGDDFIVFMNAASIEGGTFELTYNGNPYWFFHDMSHAEYDCGGGVVNIDSAGTDENRALYDGAVRAFEHGIGLSVILRELGQVLKAYEERFSGSTDCIERFAEFLENHLQTESARV